MEYALPLGPLPVGDAAVPQPDDVAVVVSGGIEHPQLTTGCGIERDRLERRRSYVHHTIHDDRVHVHRRALVRITGAIYPRRPEPVNVGGMDLCDGCVLIAFGIAAVDGP